MIQQITDHIHWLQIPFYNICTSAFIIETDEGNILYDTATTSQDVDTYLLPALKQLGEPVCTVLSHRHSDHTGGLQRLVHHYPATQVCAGSRTEGETIRLLAEGDCVLGPVRAVAIPGHTLDCIGLWDRRTDTLLTGDGLQLYGVEGCGKWGVNIPYVQEHLCCLEKLKQLPVERLIASHSYHPLGYQAEGQAQLQAYYAQCEKALYHLAGFIRTHSCQENKALAEAYRAETGLPAIGENIIANMKKRMKEGVI